MTDLDDNKLLKMYKDKGIEEGIEKGEIINSLKNAIAMFKEEFSINDVIKITKIPEENAKYICSICNNGHTNKELLELSLKNYYSLMKN